MNIHPLNKIKIVGTVVGVLVLGLVVGIKDPGTVRATANDNVHGYLFSDAPDPTDQHKTSNSYGGQGLGYISLNNINPTLPGNYGVNLDFATGQFQGYGWSEYGGYVDFAPTATVPTGAGTTAGGAHINTACLATAGPCSVLGWIKYNQVGMASLGGWDGWVSLHGTTGGGSSYGVMYDPVAGTFSGYAWGSDVVGWVDFSKATVDTVQSGDVCTDPTANNYTAPPLAVNQVSNPAVCQYGQIHVCTDPAASNYTAPPLAVNQVNDSAVCTYIGDLCQNIIGNQQSVPSGGYVQVGVNCYKDLCTNIPNNPMPQETLPTQYQGSWYNDPNADKVCTTTIPPILGCTNPNADNYDPTATVDDGSCIISPPNPCVDPLDCPTQPIKPIYKEN